MSGLKALTLYQLQNKVNEPIWIDTGANITRYVCGVVGKKQGRYIVGLPYGWEWLEDVFRMGAIYDRKPPDAPANGFAGNKK